MAWWNRDQTLESLRNCRPDDISWSNRELQIRVPKGLGGWLSSNVYGANEAEGALRGGEVVSQPVEVSYRRVGDVKFQVISGPGAKELGSVIKRELGMNFRGSGRL